MNCPFCSTKLQDIEVHTKDDQPGIISECFNCGGHWFPRWLANDITSIEAANIDAVIPKTSVNTPDQPRCPVCQTRLAQISHDPVPNGISVWTCPQGHGNFFPYKQLLQFKKAQEAKLTYHALWGIPIKSLVSVMLPVLAVLAIAGGLPLTIKEFQKGGENRTQASSIHSKPLITPISNTSALISFTTKTSHTSSLKLYQGTTLISQYSISLQPAINHQIVLEDLLPSTEYAFTITLIDVATKKQFDTESFPLIITPDGQ